MQHAAQTAVQWVSFAQNTSGPVLPDHNILNNITGQQHGKVMVTAVKIKLQKIGMGQQRIQIPAQPLAKTEHTPPFRLIQHTPVFLCSLPFLCTFISGPVLLALKQDFQDIIQPGDICKHIVIQLFLHGVIIKFLIQHLQTIQDMAKVGCAVR